MTVWPTKYAPQSLSCVLQEEASSLASALLAKQHVLLSGPVGCGKTSAVYAFAAEHNWDVFELNSSDVRNKAAIESLVGTAGVQMSLFSQHKLILIDEADGLSGVKDRGGMAALAKLLDQVKFPVVVTTTDVASKKIKPLRKKLTPLAFTAVSSTLLVPVLTSICEKEGVVYNHTDLQQLCRMSNGDVRAALLDLQVHSASGVFDLSGVCDRRPEGDITSALTLVLKGRRTAIVSSAFDDVPYDLDTCFLWLEENLPYEYQEPVDLHAALLALCSADIFRRRIRRWQYWRFLVYQRFFMTCGVAFAKREKYSGAFRLKQMRRLLMIWRSNMQNQKRKSISSKLALFSHQSTKAVFRDFAYYRSFLPSLALVLELSDDETSWLST